MTATKLTNLEPKLLVELRFPVAMALLNAAIERRERLARMKDTAELVRVIEGEQALRYALVIPVDDDEGMDSPFGAGEEVEASRG